jgi:hypothetical protein
VQPLTVLALVASVVASPPPPAGPRSLLDLARALAALCLTLWAQAPSGPVRTSAASAAQEALWLLREVHAGRPLVPSVEEPLDLAEALAALRRLAPEVYKAAARYPDLPVLQWSLDCLAIEIEAHLAHAERSRKAAA